MRHLPSPPPELVERLTMQFGKHGYDRIHAGFGSDRQPTFRTNTLKATDDQIMAYLRQHNIAYERIKSIPHAFTTRALSSREVLELPLCQEGKIYVQGLSSMIPPLVMQPKLGERILDLCAAPGSKTSQMAAIMQGTGRILAMENDEVRMQKLQHTLTRQGVTTVETQFGDAVRLCKRLSPQFDAILADVPCSAEGRISLKHPRTFRFWSQKNIVAHAKVQRSLLRAAVPTLKPGGRLVYSTCTLAPEENEDMISWLLGEFPALKLAPFTCPLSGQIQKQGCHLLPSAKHEGLFVSLLQMDSA